MGQCLDADNKPLAGVNILIIKKELCFKKKIISDPEGFFQISGLSPGQYTLSMKKEGFKPIINRNFFLDPSQTIYLRGILTTKEKRELCSRLLHLDYLEIQNQTVLDKSQIQEMPSAHNIWSLIENQDLSATTNRIDVGGLWGTIPALFSSRGGCSWTQNLYLLNGLDVSDPYMTGVPLFYPDPYSFGYTQLINSAHPPQAFSPGAYLNIIPKEETSQYHGSISAFYIDRTLQSSNISPALKREGIDDSHSFNYLKDGNFQLSGPFIPDKLFFFFSLSTSNISRDLAEYEKEDKGYVCSGFFSLKYRYSENTLRFLWSGQVVSNSSFGAGRHVPFSSTIERRDNYNVFQAIWNSRIRNNHFLKIGVCFSLGKIEYDSQKITDRPFGIEIFTKIPSGTSPFIGNDERNSSTLLIEGDSIISKSLSRVHRLQYGMKLQYNFSSSQKEITDNIHLHFFNGSPLEVVHYNTPVDHRESATNLNFFAQDNIIFSNFISLYFGFNLVCTKGWIPKNQSSQVSLENGRENQIKWLNLSPRIGFIFPVSRTKKSALKISLARYYFTFSLQYLTYGSPNSLGALVYSWEDKNSDYLYQEGEESFLLRRQGPCFSKIDSNLKRPYTDELSASFIHTFDSSWYFSISAFYRETQNLIETVNTGVISSDYEPVKIIDIGDDRIPDSHDDLTFTVYNQKIETLGQDFFLLSNAYKDERVTEYYGVDLVLLKKYSSKFSFFLSLTATQAEGITNPGNTEWENDDCIVGKLYDNPNTLINAKGRVRFDRAYTGRLGFNFLMPFDIRFGCIVKYYDGQPFSRKIVVTGMNQGPFFIQAHPRGVARYEYNRTVDIRIEKIMDFKKSRLKLIIDGFNIFNRGLATEENEWTGPEFPFRYATEIQSPRVFRLGVVYEF